eukprot:Nk52_evm24s238 gene=Nk52_evmTU24s238
MGEMRVVDNVVCSEEDKRKYRYVQLPNGICALLISDPETDYASAAADVNVGHFADPEDLPGLAHFCEHLLFMGTEKFPGENDFSQYLAEHGGYSNAYTSTENTNYYFEVTKNYLEPTLDRFSQFFIAPLLNKNAQDREIRAVNNEHEKNLKSDLWRIMQVDRSTSSPRHPISKFGTGNLATLETDAKRDVHAALVEYHRKYYSANVMGVAILGKESLDELTRMFEEKFSTCADLGTRFSIAEEYGKDVKPYTEDELAVRINVLPVKDIRQLTMTFMLPDMRKMYRKKPGRYLSHMFGHEGPGSILSALKRRGWGHSLTSGAGRNQEGYSLFKVTVEVTEEGLDHIDDIVEVFFSFVDLVRKEGIKEWIYSECQKEGATQFRFKDKERPTNLVSSVASNIRLYEGENVLSAPWLFEKYDPELIAHILSFFVPQNMRLICVAKAFEHMCGSKEKWYGTSYSISKIDKKLLDRWSSAMKSTVNDLHIPPVNEFLPEKFDILGCRSPEDVKVYPKLLSGESNSRVWYKLDDTFMLPKANLYFRILSPIAYADPTNCVLTRLFSELVKDSLNEFAYSAEIAGIDYMLENCIQGLVLVIRGYNDKLEVLFRKIIERLTNFEFTEDRFDIIKERVGRKFRNWKAESSYHHAVYMTTNILDEQLWDHEEKALCIETITSNTLREFIPMLLMRTRRECLAIGNISEADALKMDGLLGDALCEKYGNSVLSPAYNMAHRFVKLPVGQALYVYNEDTQNTNAVDMYFTVCGVQDIVTAVTLDLFAQLNSEHCFDVLRTHEQLGYMVFSSVKEQNGMKGFRVVVQSDSSACFVEQRINAFLTNFESYLTEMSSEEFSNHMTALKDHKLEKVKTLTEETRRQWHEITEDSLLFDRGKHTKKKTGKYNHDKDKKTEMCRH